MTYCIIRHKRTHGHIPWARKLAATHIRLTKEYPPRLFTSRSGARQALRWWLKGECFTGHGAPRSILDEGDYFERPGCRPQADRVASDMEIIPVVIRPLEQYELLEVD